MTDDDRAAELAEQERGRALQAHNQSRQRAADIAASRTNSDGGRDCFNCGDGILPARIKAVPTAIRCVDCQQLYDEEIRCL